MNAIVASCCIYFTIENSLLNKFWYMLPVDHISKVETIIVSSSKVNGSSLMVVVKPKHVGVF